MCKLTPKQKAQITCQMSQKGLDGQGRFETPQRGYMVAFDVLAQHGLTLADVVHPQQFQGTEGRLHCLLQTADAKDTPVSNASLSLTFYQHREDCFEVLAYIG